MFIKEQSFRSVIVMHVYQLRRHSIKTNLAVNQAATPLIRPNFHGPLVTVNLRGSTAKLSNNFAQDFISGVT